MKKLIVMIIIAITLGACSKSAGDNYIGKWQSDGNGIYGQVSYNIIISKSGDIYTIASEKTKAPIAFCPTGATLKDSKLECAAQQEFTFDPTTGKLLTPTLGTFTKIN